MSRRKKMKRIKGRKTMLGGSIAFLLSVFIVISFGSLAIGRQYEHPARMLSLFLMVAGALIFLVWQFRNWIETRDRYLEKIDKKNKPKYL